MSAVRPTPTVEDYLGVIYTLRRDNEAIIGARLAELLEVSAPTVTVTLKRMIRDGWIRMDDNKQIHLTDEGLLEAKSIVRRHMLTEWMLSRLLDIPWSQVHEEAHKIEHSISPEVATRMQARLEDPKCCPHGNPLPGHEEEVLSWQPLIDMQVGDRFIIRRVHEFGEDDRDLLSFLQKNNILPEKQGVVKDKLDFNETLTIQIDEKSVPLGYKIAKLIYATKL